MSTACGNRIPDFLAKALLDSILCTINQKCRISVTDSSGLIVFANACFCNSAGYAEEELLGRSHRLLKSGVHSPEFYEVLWHKLSSGLAWSGELCNRRKDGTLYWVETVITPVSNPESSERYFLSMSLDVSERHEARERLLLQNRYAVIGKMADSMAHDINNFLTILMLGLDNAEELACGNRELLKKTIEGIAALTKSIREHAGTATQESARFHLVDPVRHAASLVSLKFEGLSNIAIELDLQAIENEFICGAEGEISSIVLNLLINACEVLVNQRNPRISIQGFTTESTLSLAIRDNGPGLPASVQEGLFERPVSTKGGFRGQGLIACRQLMRRNRGEILCETSPQGTCFTMTFPKS